MYAPAPHATGTGDEEEIELGADGLPAKKRRKHSSEVMIANTVALLSNTEEQMTWQGQWESNKESETSRRLFRV